MIRKIDHIAIAVTKLDEEIPRYRDLLGLEFCGTEEVPEQKVKVAFFKIGDAFIELLEPLTPDSPIAGFLEKRGPGIHHLAVETSDIVGEIATLKGKGARMLNDEPKDGAHAAKIAFVHPKSGGGVLLELKQPGAHH